MARSLIDHHDRCHGAVAHTRPFDANAGAGATWRRASAYALLAESAVLLLDEPTAALGSEEPRSTRRLTNADI